MSSTAIFTFSLIFQFLIPKKSQTIVKKAFKGNLTFYLNSTAKLPHFPYSGKY